jgi:DNA mismatch endonuclease (patch repair protein)
MLGNGAHDTAPELALRSMVHAAGPRYRVAAKPLPKTRRTADMVFRPVRVAVFVDGCSWHGCERHFVPPKTNPDYWWEKIGGNMRRDRETDERLADAGWLVLCFWSTSRWGSALRSSSLPSGAARQLGNARMPEVRWAGARIPSPAAVS